jgi:hypothetical protein
MKELCEGEALLIITLRIAIELGMYFSYQGEIWYDPYELAYWGA